MVEPSDNTPGNLPDHELESRPTTAADLAEAITELEQYRERLVNDTLDTAKRAKMIKDAVMAKLEPELANIDAMLADLRSQQAALSAQN
jgi:capsule polysaccharide export protein KpsE/RkpR